MDRDAPGGAATTTTSVAGDHASAGHRAPAMSVIITTPDSYETIRALVGRLRAQTACAALEVIVVAPSAAAVHAGLADLQDFCCWRVVEIGAMRTVAQAKAAGIRQATAPLVVLTEDHSLPDPAWAQALIEAHRHDWAAVGPAMHNGNPESLVSWADFLLGYGPWCNPAEAGEVDELPGHNSAYKRALLLKREARLEALLGAETVLHHELRAGGHRLYLEPAAKTFHINFTEPRRWIPYLFHSGRVFAAVRAQRWPLWHRAAYSAAALLIPLVRLRRLLPVIRRACPDLLPRVIAPVLFALTVDAIGQWMGYTAGAGRSAEHVARLEYHRDGNTARVAPRAVAPPAAPTED